MSMRKKQQRAGTQAASRPPKQKLHLLPGAPADADLEKLVDEMIAAANPPQAARPKKRSGRQR